MADERDVDTTRARALLDAGRMKVVHLLNEGPLTAEGIAKRLGMEHFTAARLARELTELGVVRATGRPAVYEIINDTTVPDDVWEQLPEPVRKAAAAEFIDQIAARATSAIDAGGFDRRDVELSHSSVVLDEEGWIELSRHLGELRARLQEAAERSAERLADEPAQAYIAQVVLMLFAGSGAAPHAEEADEHAAPAFTDEEGRARAGELLATLQRLLEGDGPDWPSLLARVDELRVVLQAAAADAQRRKQLTR